MFPANDQFEYIHWQEFRAVFSQTVEKLEKIRFGFFLVSLPRKDFNYKVNKGFMKPGFSIRLEGRTNRAGPGTPWTCFWRCEWVVWPSQAVRRRVFDSDASAEKDNRFGAVEAYSPQEPCSPGTAGEDPGIRCRGMETCRPCCRIPSERIAPAEMPSFASWIDAGEILRFLRERFKLVCSKKRLRSVLDAAWVGLAYKWGILCLIVSFS